MFDPIHIPIFDRRYFAPDFKLHLTPSASMDNQNRPEELHSITSRILQNLKNLQGAPSVQMHPAPPDFMVNRETIQEAEDSRPDERGAPLNKDGGTKKEHEAEMYDAEGSGGLQDRDRSSGKDDSMDVANNGELEVGTMGDDAVDEDSPKEGANSRAGASSEVGGEPEASANAME